MVTYYTYLFLQGLAEGLFLPLWILYMMEKNVSLYIIGVLGTVLEITRFLTEVPLGGFADHFGRKTSLIFGALFSSISILLFSIFQNMTVLFLSIIIMGLGNSFQSGALEAWLADHLIKKKQEDLFNKKLTIAYMCMIVGAVIGALLISKFYSINISLPFKISSFIFGLSFITVTFFFNEELIEQQKFSMRNNIESIKEKILQGFGFIRGHKYIKLVMYSAFFYAWALDGIERFYQGFLDKMNVQPFFISGIFIFSSLIGILLMFYGEKMNEKIKSEISTLFIIRILMAISIVFITKFTQNGNLIYFMLIFFFGLNYAGRPLIQSYLNKNISSEFRATVLSYYELIGSSGEVFAGITIGYLAKQFGITNGLFASGCIIIFAAMFLTSFVELRKKDTEFIKRV